ncbi:MAG TPA: hypothetical protein DCL86_17835 [Bacteroidales bacterium]|nr:hypothetical protein [Bacteroidales bacterium]
MAFFYLDLIQIGLIAFYKLNIKILFSATQAHRHTKLQSLIYRVLWQPGNFVFLMVFFYLDLFRLAH